MQNVICTVCDKEYYDIYGKKMLTSLRLFGGDYKIFLVSNIENCSVENTELIPFRNDVTSDLGVGMNSFTKLHKSWILRKLILDGFNPIYLDVDILCMKNIDDIFNYNRPTMKDEYPNSIGIEAKLLNHYYPEDKIKGIVRHNFNTGVITGFGVRDIPLLNYWEGLLLKYWLSKKSDRGDQFFFNTAVMNLNYKIDILPVYLNHFAKMWDGRTNSDTVFCHFCGHKGNKMYTNFGKIDPLFYKIDRITNLEA